MPSTDVAVPEPSLPDVQSARVIESPLSNVSLQLVESLDDALAMSRWLGERRETPVGIDVESGGLDPFRQELRLVQLGDKHTGWSVPFPLWGGFAQELMQRYDGQWVGHNVQFDWRFIKRHAGIELPWHQMDDTMVMAAVIDPTATKGLKPLSSRLIDKNATAGQRLLDDGMKANGWTWATVPYNFPPYWAYASLDPVLTCRLWEIQQGQIYGTRNEAIYQMEIGTCRVAANMMDHGMLIDEAYIHDAIAKLDDFAGQARTWLKEVFGVTSLLAARQLAKAFASLGWEITQTTPTGQPKVDKELLELLSLETDQVPERVTQLAKTVLQARHVEKVKGSYLEKFLELADGDGFVHPQINTLQARTGRMSITEPALQTLHRDDKIVRGAFIPRPGHSFITCDYSQVEMRLAAALSEDEGLIAAFAEADSGGRDFYSGIAGTMFGEEISKKDHRRQAVKSMSYAKLYGASVGTMARTVGLPVDQVKAIDQMFVETFPGLDLLARRTVHEAKMMAMNGERPATFTTSGRFLPCDKGREFALMNYKLQGEAAEVLKRATLECDAAGLGEYMRLPVHDEIIFEVPNDLVEEVTPIIVSSMEDRTRYPVPLTCDAAVLTERWQKA